MDEFQHGIRASHGLTQCWWKGRLHIDGVGLCKTPFEKGFFLWSQWKVKRQVMSLFHLRRWNEKKKKRGQVVHEENSGLEWFQAEFVSIGGRSRMFILELYRELGLVWNLRFDIEMDDTRVSCRATNGSYDLISTIVSYEGVSGNIFYAWRLNSRLFLQVCKGGGHDSSHIDGKSSLTWVRFSEVHGIFVGNKGIIKDSDIWNSRLKWVENEPDRRFKGHGFCVGSFSTWGHFRDKLYPMIEVEGIQVRTQISPRLSIFQRFQGIWFRLQRNNAYCKRGRNL